jgi:hypothetical protein
MAAQRARAFGLAIMGESDRATAIVEQVMPRDLATRLVPYLGYMPRLTKPQQAAAANLGLFPRAADIGREDPRLARFAVEERADSRLAPTGPPLGSASAAAPAIQPAARNDKGRSAARAPVAPAPATAPGSPPARVATVTPVAVSTAPTPVASAPVAAPPAAVAPAPEPVSEPVPAPAPRMVRVADAFADLGAPMPDARAGADAVDISRIEVKRETASGVVPISGATTPTVAKAAEKAKAKPKEPPKPKHPSRVWVQVATGRKVDALAFDWKRLSKAGGATLARQQANTAKWGQTNRLLVGPLASRDKAEALVRELKKKDLDVFLYVSPEGEEVQPLK